MPQKCLQVFLIVLLTLGVLQAPSAGQSTPAATAPTSPAADEAFKPLQREFENLYKSLQNKGGVGKEDRPALEALRKKITAFGAQFPDDPRGPAAELYLAVWLEDQASVDAIYGKILKTRPTDVK